MAGLLDWITGAVKQQYAQGAPYREAIGGLLQGDPTKFGLLAQEFNRKAQTPEGALDVALNFAPLGVTKIVSPKTQYEIAQEVAQRNAALPVSEGGLGLPKNNTAMDRAKAMGAEKAILDSRKDVLWHGSPTQILDSNYGIHLGTKEAAKQALEARIGIPSSGYGWEGKSQYGQTELAGKNRLLELDPKGYNITGYNSNAGAENYFPTGTAKYSSGDLIPLNTYPSIQPYMIAGEMSNTRLTPMSDSKANALMPSMIKQGKAKRGYYYKNEGEDVGSISAVVPNSSFVYPINEELMMQLPNNNLRSKFAAFDPFRRNEADILAGLLAVPATQLMKPEEKKKKRNTK